MFPTSSIAKPLFADVLALVIVGVMRRRTRTAEAFEVALREHVDEHLPTLRQIRTILARSAGFDADIAEMIFDESMPKEWSENDAYLWLRAIMGEPRAPQPTTSADQRLLADAAGALKLVDLLEDILIVQCSAEIERMPFDEACIDMLLELGVRLSEGEASNTELVQRVARNWLDGRWHELRGRPTDTHTWLVSRVKHLAGREPREGAGRP